MDLLNYIDEVNAEFEGKLERLPEVRADEVGLDSRAASRMWIGDGYIVVGSRTDRGLQYYGGFEYVDQDSRKQLGDWVIYAAEDDNTGRVQQILDRYAAANGSVDEEEDE